MSRFRMLDLLTAGALVAGLLAGGAAAQASHFSENCRNEPLLEGGDDVGADLGPGIFFVGADKGDQSGGVPGDGFYVMVCAGSEFLGFDSFITFDRGDLPRTEPGDTCVINVLEGPCEVESFQFWVGDGDSTTLRFSREGTIAPGTTNVVIPGGEICVIGVAPPCP